MTQEVPRIGWWDSESESLNEAMPRNPNVSTEKSKKKTNKKVQKIA